MTLQRAPNVIARPPPPHRSPSQQYNASPISTRGKDESKELATDGENEQSHQRPLASRLKLDFPTALSPAEVLGSPRSSTVAASSWKTMLPPLVRPQLHCDTPILTSPSGRPASNICVKGPFCKSMPMPVRPRKHCTSIPKSSLPSTTASTKKNTRPKPYALEVPAAAPRYSPNGRSDFFPWTGNHPEDQFSENIIRQGYFDKAQAAQSEMSSARPIVLSALKHKSGLQALSSVFTNIFAQRRSYGQISSASTFKPPPRVTVTDTKREMWLKDLANPTISLRRLSRSIPHGIRGRGLLEQSLGKNIPIERAVWLAKCVGANELRSFRRKGVSGTFALGGESKWIRDFTVCVEQFLENIIGSCGEADFKTKICYAVRLATHFHAEYLLDREHYLEWLVMSLENTPQSRLPLWLLVIQIYWKELLRFRKYGHRLSGVLLNQLAETIDNPDSDLLAPLSERLIYLLKELMLCNYGNFVDPKVWAKHRDLVYSHVGADNVRLSAIIKSIDTRNSRLAIPEIPRKLTPQQNLIKILDRSLISPYSNKIVKEGWQLSQDKGILTQTVLDWSTSSYRPKKTKTYVAARLLRAWSKFGANITDEVLDFIDAANCEVGRNKPDLYHLISELVRSGHFSTPKYIQWLIARGNIMSPGATELDGPCASRLLAELPTTHLSESISQIRTTLLYRANFPVNEESYCLKRCLSFLDRDLPHFKTTIDSGHQVISDLTQEAGNFISGVSRTIKSEIGLWLRERVGLQIVEPLNLILVGYDKSTTNSRTSAISLSDFKTVRKTLENIGDFSMLADVLKIISSSNNIDVLASCTDTLNLHLEIFAAIGATAELFEILLSRLRTLTDYSDSVPRTFLTSLLDLSLRLEKKSTAQELAHELSRSYRRPGIDACSPVSDHMTASDNMEAYVIDDIEKVLNSGNALDHAEIKQLFQRIISMFESSWNRSSEQQRNCGILLTRLKSSDVELFNKLMANWVEHFFCLPSRPSVIQVFAPLISSECLTLDEILESCTTKQNQDKNTVCSEFGGIHLEVLDLLLSSSKSSDIMTTEETYRFRIKQLDTQRNSPVKVITALRLAFEVLSPKSSPLAKTSDTGLCLNSNFFRSEDFLDVLQRAILFNTDIFVHGLLLPILKGSNNSAKLAINTAMDLLLLSAATFSIITVEFLLDIANDLSLPFCQVKLTSIFRADKDMKVSEDRLSSFEKFSFAVESAIAAGNTAWNDMLPHLDVEIAQILQQRAETQFLSLVPSPKTASGVEFGALRRRIPLGKSLLLLVTATSSSISSTASSGHDSASLISEISAALNGIWILLATSQSQEVKDFVLWSWIPLLLSFITAHAILFESSNSWPESQAKTVMALAAIFLQLQALDTNSEDLQNIMEQSYDLALLFVDYLPDDFRRHCIRSLRDTASNPQISYLFSCAGAPIERLFMKNPKNRNVDSKPIGSTSNEMTPEKENLIPFLMRRWEMLGDPTPNVGENDTSPSLTLFGSRRG